MYNVMYSKFVWHNGTPQFQLEYIATYTANLESFIVKLFSYLKAATKINLTKQNALY